MVPKTRHREAKDALPGIQMYQDYSLLNRKEFVMDNSIYLTVPQSPRYEQINLFDLLAGTVSPEAIPRYEDNQDS